MHTLDVVPRNKRMNNTPLPTNPSLRTSLEHRWPHDHFLFLWFAPTLALFAALLHLRMPWNSQPMFALLSILALLLLPGGVLLSWLAPSSSEAQHQWNSPGYILWSRVRWLVTPIALISTIWSWWAHQPGWLCLSLVLLCATQWMPVLQERILVTSKAAWHLGFPIQATFQQPGSESTSNEEVKHPPNDASDNVEHSSDPSNKVEHHPETSDEPHSCNHHHDENEWLLGEPLPTPFWRRAVFVVLGLGWTAAIVWANTGNSARLPGYFSLTTLSLWLLGVATVYLVSRLSAPWQLPAEAYLLWKEQGVVQQLYFALTLPLSLLVAAIALVHIGHQLWLASPIDFAVRAVFSDFLLVLVGLWLFTDPSGMHAWIAKPSPSSNTYWVRRYGWIERFQDEEE